MKLRKTAGVLMMILGFWLFFIPIYIGYCVFTNKKAFKTLNKDADWVIKILFGLMSLLVPGIILLCIKSKIVAAK
jgi:hypothetical protein